MGDAIMTAERYDAWMIVVCSHFVVTLYLPLVLMTFLMNYW